MLIFLYFREDSSWCPSCCKRGEGGGNEDAERPGSNCAWRKVPAVVSFSNPCNGRCRYDTDLCHRT